MHFNNPSILITLPFLWATIFLLYLIRSRPPLKPFPYLKFFQEIEPPSSSILRRKRPPRLIQLLLDLLIVTSLVMALSQPSLKTYLYSHIVLVVDNSLSLQATDIYPSRWEALKKEGEELLKKQKANKYSLVVGAPPYPKVITSSYSSDIINALKNLKPIAEGFMAQESMDTAKILSQEESLIYLLTDGCLKNFTDLSSVEGGNYYLQDVVLSSLPAQVKGGNIIFKRLLLEERGEEGYAFISIQNDSPEDAFLKLTLSQETPITSLEVSLKSWERRELFLKLPQKFPYLVGKIEIIRGIDHLNIDNEAFAVKERNRELNIGLLGRENLFLRAALSSASGIKYSLISEEDLKKSEYDLFFLLSFLPAKIPLRPTVFLDIPAEESEEITFSSENSLEFIKLEHPILSYVDLEELQIKKVSLRKLTFPAEDGKERAKKVILSANYEGEIFPLIYVEEGNPAYVVFNFFLDSSNLTLLPAFPILINNLISYLADTEQASTLGDIITGNGIEVVTPSGKIEQIEDIYTFKETGIYLLTSIFKSQYVAINPPPEESALKPTLLTTASQEKKVKLPYSLTPFFLFAALMLVLLSIYFFKRFRE